jgi:hypothetical protein
VRIGGGEKAARDTHAGTALTGLLVVVCALITAACPVPMRYTERLAPAIIGVVRTETGAPAAGVALAVSTHADCRRQVAADTSDATGTFRIPAADRPRRLAWIGPFELPPPVPFYVCADSGVYERRIAFTGGVPAVPLGKPPLRPDTLVCVESRDRSRRYLRCSERSPRP